MTRVVHVNKEPFDVYIGRTTRRYKDEGFGNPWVIGRDGTRSEVIAKYEQALKYRLKLHPEVLDKISALKDKVLGCWCKPEKCHGDVLAEIADNIDYYRTHDVSEQVDKDSKSLDSP